MDRLSSLSPVRRVLLLATPVRARLALGTVALLVSAALTLAYPLLASQIVDGALGGEGRAAVDRALPALIAMFGAGGLFTAARAYLFTTAGERVVAKLRRDLYAAIVRQDIAFFDERRTGELTNRLASDTTVLQNTVTVNVSMALRNALTGIGAIGILFWTSWRLTLLMLAIVPVAVVAGRIYGRLVRKVSREVQDAAARATEVAEETLAGIRTVRAFAREAAESRRYAQRVDDVYALARQRARLSAIFMGGASFVGYAGIAAVVWYGGILLTQGELTMGELTSFLLYTFTVAFSVGAMTGLWEDLQRAIGASERVFELLDHAPAVAGGEKRLEGVAGQVRFEDVCFAYPSRSDVRVLDHLSVQIAPGEVVALVGPSGAGKTTVAALLSRFYDPEAGTLRLDGIDLRELDPAWLREQVGVVSQEPVLFATTVRENILYGRPGATREEVEAAARAANAHAFVSAFPTGYETIVGERGVRLSGGQKQRVAIARAVLKDPRILVLDEATSALDAEAEHLVKEALERLMQGRTTLIIAHRLSTVMSADRVLVLDAGRIVQQGTHASLVAADGLYRRLVERQFAAA